MSIASIIKAWPANPLCHRCRRRQAYTVCSRCYGNLCALCSWPSAYTTVNDVRSVDERCRECADK